jgi:hypothetical protein
MSNLKKDYYKKPKTDFKNVEIKLPHNSDYKYEYRPIIEQVERLNRLSDELKANPKTVVNFLIDVGLECFERSIPRLKDEINSKVQKKMKGLLK